MSLYILQAMASEPEYHHKHSYGGGNHTGDMMYSKIPMTIPEKYSHPII